jgi:hypothetical protein
MTVDGPNPMRQRAPAVALVAALGLVLLLLAGRPALGAASSRTNSTQTIEVKSLQDGRVIADSKAKLHRRFDRLSVHVRTSELEPGEVVDVFWAVFDNPSACVHGNPVTGVPCGPPDLFVEATDATLQLAATVTADASGRVAYSASIAVGDTSGCVAGFPCGDGVTNPLGAEVHSAMFNEAGGRQAAQFLTP